MKGTLLLSILSVRSNFIENIEIDAEDNPETDTAQWWIGPTEAFSITTHALNHDIRIWAVPAKEGMIPVIQDMQEKSYGDVTARRIWIELENALDQDEVATKFAEYGLEPTVVISEEAFLYWRYGTAEYQGLSGPELVG